MTAKRKILVADDDPSVLELLNHILVTAGYEVILVQDGQSAIERAWSERPHLVLIDGLLPKLHGFHVCKKVKEFTRPPRVIIMSGVYTKPRYSLEVKKEYGADDFIAKPFSVPALLAAIEKQLILLQRDEAAA